MKAAIRKELKSRRRKVTTERRKEASFAAFSTLSNFSNRLLSFASFGDEIDLWQLNAHLAERGMLHLPKVEDRCLKIFQVRDIKRQLCKNRLGFLEPIPSLCPLISPELIALVLVPALGFDSKGHRVGYGGGFYDRFLGQLPPSCQSIGVCFKEQQQGGLFPCEEHDVAVDALMAF